MDIVWENKSRNHEKVRELLDATKPSEGSLVLLPEMFSTGFSMNVEGIDDGESRESQQFISETSSRYGVMVLGGIAIRDQNGRGRNECIVFSADGREVDRYCKMHPFSFGGEADHYVAGDRVVVLECGEFRIAPFICYDLRFPEVFRSAVKLGANLLCVIANWPSAREAHWTALLKARAIENQAYVAAVNRAGSDPALEYPGRSMIIDPRGEALVEAGGEECTISAQLDLESLSQYRRQFPVLQDLHDDYVK